MYAGLSSMEIESRPSCWQTRDVVNAPANGSKTTPPAGQPARMHGSISFGGKVAKCAPLYGAVAMVQTVRLLRVWGMTAIAASKLELFLIPLPGAASFRAF